MCVRRCVRLVGVFWFCDSSSVARAARPQLTPRTRRGRSPLKHSIYEGAEVCVITKDPQKEFRQAFAARKVAGVSKVVSHVELACARSLALRSRATQIIGLSKLRTNYRDFDAKRKLCDSYDLFLADSRVLPYLPRLLGKKFFNSKKYGEHLCRWSLC